MTGMFAQVCSATVDGEDQTSPKLGLHCSRNTAALWGRWSKPGHGDAQQHLPHCKETERTAIGKKNPAIGKERQRGGDGTSNNPVTFISFSQAQDALSPMGGQRVLGQLLPPAASTHWDAHRDMFFLNLSLFGWTSGRGTKHRPLNLPARTCGNATTGNQKRAEAPVCDACGDFTGIS